MNIKDGTKSKAEVGTKISSNSLAADFVRPPEIFDDNTRKTAAKPRTNPKIKFNSALRTSGSNDAQEPCDSTGVESELLSAPKIESEIMLVSDCGASNKPAEGVDSILGDAVGDENFLQSKLVQSIGISQPDTLESSDLDNVLVQNIIPSFSSRSNVHSSEYHDVLQKSNF